MVKDPMVSDLMFNFTPPHVGNVVKGVCLLLLFLVFFGAYMRGYQAGMCSSVLENTSGAPRPVELDRAVFYNHDSIYYYTLIATHMDDPRALFITGMATRLRFYDPDYPLSIPDIAIEEADYMLIRAAQLGCDPAMKYIHSLAENDQWLHFIPHTHE